MGQSGRAELGGRPRGEVDRAPVRDHDPDSARSIPPMAPPPAAPRLNSEPLSVIVVPAPLGVSAVSTAVMATPCIPHIRDVPATATTAPAVPT